MNRYTTVPFGDHESSQLHIGLFQLLAQNYIVWCKLYIRRQRYRLFYFNDDACCDNITFLTSVLCLNTLGTVIDRLLKCRLNSTQHSKPVGQVILY